MCFLFKVNWLTYIFLNRYISKKIYTVFKNATLKQRPRNQDWFSSVVKPPGLNDTTMISSSSSFLVYRNYNNIRYTYYSLLYLLDILYCTCCLQCLSILILVLSPNVRVLSNITAGGFRRTNSLLTVLIIKDFWKSLKFYYLF